MNPHSLPRFAPRIVAWIRVIGVPSLLLAAAQGYTQPGLAQDPSEAPALARGAMADTTKPVSLDVPLVPSPLPPEKGEGERVESDSPATNQGEKLTAPRVVTPSSRSDGRSADTATHSANVVPLGLDTVLRLAEEQNPQIALARERVREAFAEKDLADMKWLPDVYVGTAFYRHEGGIQNEDGTLTHSSTGALFAGLELDGKLDIREVAYQQVNAKRQLWQQRGELSRVTNETLLEAAETYIDFLAARTGEAITREMEQKLHRLDEQAEKLVKTEPGFRVEMLRVRAELDAQAQGILKLRNQSAGAAAKLLYLLGLDPAAQLVPVDARLVPFDLVDATAPTADLVARALASGPGVREMEGLIALINESIEKSKGPAKYLPIFEMRMAEGAFGAGPGDTMDWDNRWDLGLQARWNLTELVTQKDRRHVAMAKIQQAHLGYQELRAKLTAGVQDAQDTILSGPPQMRIVESQMENAQQAYKLTDLRLRENAGGTFTESLLTLSSLGKAQASYVAVISSYDKAQIRLMVLLGPEARANVAARSAH